MSEKIKLLDCHCGGEAFYDTDDQGVHFYVICSDCMVHTTSHGRKSTVAEIWNRRQNPPQELSDGELEALKKLYIDEFSTHILYTQSESSWLKVCAIEWYLGLYISDDEMRAVVKHPLAKD